MENELKNFNCSDILYFESEEGRFIGRLVNAWSEWFDYALTREEDKNVVVKDGFSWGEIKNLRLATIEERIELNKAIIQLGSRDLSSSADRVDALFREDPDFEVYSSLEEVDSVSQGLIEAIISLKNDMKTLIARKEDEEYEYEYDEEEDDENN